MLESYINTQLDQTDLNFYECGKESPAPGFGPSVRDHFVIHFIIEGKGTYYSGNTAYRISKGQGFLICPGILARYEADGDDPWSYYWAGFHGKKAESYLKLANLTAQNPVFTFTESQPLISTFSEMVDARNLQKGRNIKLLGLLHILLYELVEANGRDIVENNAGRKESHIKSSIEFIKKNYSRKITIEDISQYIGLDRRYFCSIFKKYMSVSPQQFLLNFRLGKACELIQNSDISIGDIARSVGYEDPLLFSKMFKKAKGISPKNYKLNIGKWAN